MTILRDAPLKIFIILLTLALTACTQPTVAPSATLLPPTRITAPSDTVTPPPVLPTATITPSPVPSNTPKPTSTATLDVSCPEVESSSITTLAIQGMILFRETEGFYPDYKDTIYSLTALRTELQPIFNALPQGLYSEFHVSSDGKWLSVRHDDVLMITNTHEQIIIPWENENWANYMGGWLADHQRLMIVPLYEDDVVQQDEIIVLNPFTGYQERIAPALPYPEDIYPLIDSIGLTAYFDPTLTRVAYKISDATLVLWDLEDGRELWRLVEPTLMFDEQPTWSPDGNFLAVVDAIGDQTATIALNENVTFQTLLIDRTGEVVWQDPYSYYDDWTSSTVFTWSPNGRYVALSRMSTAQNESSSLILDTTSMEVSDYCISRRVASRVIWSPDSQQFIVWSTQQGTPSNGDEAYQNILVDLSRNMVVRLEGISLEPVAWIDTDP